MRRLYPRVPGRYLRSALLVTGILSGTAFGYFRWMRPEAVEQPIRFSHRAHVAGAQIDCAECHSYFSKGAHSGLPGAEVCATCHAEALTQNPEEARLRTLVQNGRPVVFRKLFQLPSHVYYSHRRHVVAGKLPCAGCHGAIAETEAPPPRPLVEISMDFCTRCHAASKVTNDCKSCHR